MRSFRPACGLPIALLALLLTSCATVQKEPAPPASEAAPTGAAPPAPEQAELSAALAEEAAKAKEQAMAESRAREQTAAAQQARPLTKEEVEAQVAAMKPKPAKEEAAPLVVEKEVAVEAAMAPASPAEEIPASPFVFTVRSAPKDPSHPFYGVGSKFGFIINGVPGKELVLVRGKTYTFKVNTDVKHDFYLSLSRTGWGAATYSKGVAGNFTYHGIVTFTPDASTPDTLYYQCRNHKNMGGIIHVVNEGEELKVRQAAAAAAARAAASSAAQEKSGQSAGVDKAQVKQKIAFANMFINQSQAAKRISGSSNVDAFEMYRSAQAKFKESQAALAEENFAQALALVDESLRLMSEASRRVPSQADAESLRTRFEEMLEGTKTFEASYQRNFKRLSKQKHGKEIPQLDLPHIHGQIARAQQLAQESNYAEALRILAKVQEKLNTALTEMLHEETMSYELVFETPKEEYEYELSRYASYAELVPLAIEQRRPPKQTVDLMHKFVEKAKGIKDQALPVAAKGDYKTAILMLQGATSHIQRALRLAGVR